MLPDSMPLSSAGLEVSVPEWGALLPEDTTNTLLTWKLRLPLERFGLLMPLSQQTKKETAMSGGVNDPHYQEEIGLLLHNEDRLCLECRRSFRASLGATKSCD